MMSAMDRKVSPFVVFFLAVCATLVCAAAAVRIEEWSIPSADRFPHDPAVAPDGHSGSRGWAPTLWGGSI